MIRVETKTNRMIFPVKPYTSVPLAYLLIQVYSCTIDLLDVCKYINIKIYIKTTNCKYNINEERTLFLFITLVLFFL